MSLASLMPRPETTSRTTLMTWIFLSPAPFEDEVKLVLLFSRVGGSNSSAGSSNGDGGSCGDLEGLLECLHEFAELQEGQFPELIH